MLNHELSRLPPLAISPAHQTDLTSLNTLQSILYPYLPLLETFWWAVFILTFCYLVTHYFFAAKSAPAGADAHIGEAPARTYPLDLGEMLAGWYRRFFHIREIEHSETLRLLGGALLIGYLSNFSYWIRDTSISLSGVKNGTSICWPFFQSCERFIFLDTSPQGGTLTLVYMLLMGVILTGAWSLIVRRIAMAHLCLLVLFAWSVYAVLLSYTYDYAANYTYYLLSVSFVYIFCAHKRFFACLTFAGFYYLSTAAKLTDSWILGTYFTSLKGGLTMLPDSIAPLITNLVIAMEMVGAWLLFSRDKCLQRGALAFFTFFHLYSGMYVGYHYPSIVLPMLLVLFGPTFTPFEYTPKDRSSLRGWVLIGTLLLLQSAHLAIPGDRRLTMEGNFYGLFMFEANHQCLVHVSHNDALLYERRISKAHLRCDPYKHMKDTQRLLCGDKTDGAPADIRFTVLHSLNGGPFYQIVNEADLCSLTYKPFSRNEWIKTQETAPALFRPLKNDYR